MAYSVCHAPLELYMSKMLPEVHTMDKFDFLKPMITHFQIINTRIYVHDCQRPTSQKAAYFQRKQFVPGVASSFLRELTHTGRDQKSVNDRLAVPKCIPLSLPFFQNRHVLYTICF